MDKHMCEYCCWYSEQNGCEVPFVMKHYSCNQALKKKEYEEAKAQQNSSYNK